MERGVQAPSGEGVYGGRFCRLRVVAGAGVGQRSDVTLPPSEVNPSQRTAQTRSENTSKTYFLDYAVLSKITMFGSSLQHLKDLTHNATQHSSL